MTLGYGFSVAYIFQFFYKKSEGHNISVLNGLPVAAGTT